MSRLAVTRAEAPAMIRPRGTALGLRGALGAAALAGSLVARYRLGGTWLADAELHVLTPPAPGQPIPARAERTRAEAPRPPLHIRLSADIRLLRRLLTERVGAPASPGGRRAGQPEPARLETRRPEVAARAERATPVARERAERPGRERAARSTLPGPAVIRTPAPAAGSGPSSATILRPIHTHGATETRSLLVIRSLAPTEPSAGAPVMAVRTATASRAETATREAGRADRREGLPSPVAQARASPGPDAARPALPCRLAGEPAPLEIVRRDAAPPDTPGAEATLDHPARSRPLASRTRAAAARLVAEQTPKLAVRSRRGPGPSLDRRTLAGRAAPTSPRITPIIPRAVSQPATPGEQAAPTRVMARRTSREGAPAILEGAAMLDAPAPVIAQPAARLPGAPTLTPVAPAPAPGTPRQPARGDQRRQAVALDVRRTPVPVAPPAPAARETAERTAEPRERAGQRTEAKAKPAQIDAPTLRKALNELPIGEFEPLADRLIAEFEWQLKRGLERSGRL
jgi:hypothetical protein